MKKRTYILDSFALLAYFQDEPGADKVEEILLDAKENKAEALLCTINLGEIYYVTSRLRGERTAKEIMLTLAQLPISEVEAQRDLVLEAARLKARVPVAYADCFAAALAIQQKGMVVTGDPEFEKLAKSIEVFWIG